MRATLPPSSLLTHTAFLVTARSAGPSAAPTGTVAVTAPRRGSISETVPSSALAIQTPAAPTARAETPRATGILVVTGSAAFAPILISVTVPEDGLLAHTTPEPQASFAGWLPSGTVSVFFPDSGSRRTTAWSSGLATQTAPPPMHRPSTVLATR